MGTDKLESIELVGEIPEQTPVPWAVAFSVSWSSLKRRIFRSFITMMGVILAIAFLSYMLVNDNITKALILADQGALNVLLQKAGVDIFAGTGTDSRMMLLIGLSLLTCLVGIVNAMLMSVTERIKEIGTMKCLGALNRFILKTYFIEASLQGIVGTLIGMIIGLVVGLLATLYSYHGYVFEFFPYVPIIKALIISFVVGTGMSIVAAIAPAQWAATKEPVDAMRAEE